MILKRFILSISIILSVLACNRFNGPKKPDNLISKEKMIDILIDAKLVASVSSVHKEMIKNKGIDVDTYVYTKHGIDSLQFALSNNYYAFHLEDYEAIYNKVEDSLNALKTKYKDLGAKEWKEKTKKEEDSLSKSLSKQKDTLGLSIAKDSLNKALLKKKTEGKRGIIKPISDSDFQLQ